MSSLAILTNNLHIKVSGSDLNYDEKIEVLKKYNIKVNIGHSENNIDDDCDLICYSGAIKEDNVEYMKAKEKGIMLVERSEYLGELCKLFKNVIAIGGTHGKTTTTAMISLILKNAGLNPTVHLGGISNDFKSNYLIGKFDYFITEACEYRNSFKYIKSDNAVILSIEADHLDSYNSLTEHKMAFKNFAKNSNFVILTPNSKGLDLKNNYSLIGINDNCDLYAKNIRCDKFGKYSFDVFLNKVYLANFKLNVIGEYNVYNALCAISIALRYNVSIPLIYDSLIEFSGVKRRNEKVAVINNIPIICDYAHHPTEIKNSINANKKVYKNIMVIFQPHTYSRTLQFFDDFINSFKGIKKLIIYKTYPARENFIKGGDATDIYEKVKFNKNNKFYNDNKFQLKRTVYQNLNGIDCILVLGAGNIYDIIKNVFK